MTTGITVQDRQVVTIRHACALVGVSRRTLYYWIKSGKVQAIRTAGKTQRVFVDTLRCDGDTPEAPTAP